VIDLLNIPFSRFGSYYVISIFENDGEKNLYLRDVRGGDSDLGCLFILKVLDDDHHEIPVQDMSISCTETLLRIQYDTSFIEVLFPDEETVRFHSNGPNLCLDYLLKRYDNIFKYEDNTWELCSYSHELKLIIKVLQGEMIVDAPWDTIGNTQIKLYFKGMMDNTYDFIIESYVDFYKPENKVFLPFEENKNQMSNLYNTWYESVIDIPVAYEDEKKLAAYITWANFVKPEDVLTRYAMYMSKNWMTNIWSWDNCFSAIYLSKFKPHLALDQFMLFADLQHETGMYPDFANNKYVSYSCTKPPIHGWCYQYLIKNNKAYFMDAKHLEAAYSTLTRMTEFWLKYRMSTYGLPFYVHGNDSGWDNSTLFNEGIPVITPDLSAYLINQIDFLSEIAFSLGHTEESESWKEISNKLLDRLLEFLWRENHFSAFLLSEDRYIQHHNSLQLYLPIIISNRLPKEVSSKLIADLKNSHKFLTPYGLATESMNSQFYKKNGYWRGPIWAPIMLILIDSLKNMGEENFAYMLASRFCKAVKIGKMAENFDPMTGEGLVDPAFAWTSSVFMTLANEYL